MRLNRNRRIRTSPYELHGQALNLVCGVNVIFSRLLPSSSVLLCQLVHRSRNALGLCLAGVATAGCLQRVSAFLAIDVDIHQSDHMDEDPVSEGVGSSRL
jgi:hypothetical protein